LRAISNSVVLVARGLWERHSRRAGVTIFFLSGYLITTLLMDERERSGRIDIGSFIFAARSGCFRHSW
jgi:peptidoglycan/LPS O-acetylase OafA/YrhL